MLVSFGRFSDGKGAADGILRHDADPDNLHADPDCVALYRLFLLRRVLAPGDAVRADAAEARSILPALV